MRRLLFVLFVLASPVLWNCSENDTVPVADQSEPEVRIFYPYDTEPTTFVVADSIDVYFGAHDLGPGNQPAAPAKVELWFSAPGDTARVFIGTAGSPISIDQVPADIRPIVNVPAGWSLYTRRWYTGPKPLPPIGTPINSNTDVQLFALAHDAAGNTGRTPDIIRIHVFNTDIDNGPPWPEFTISPQSGTTLDVFSFDPSATRDRYDPVHQIRVRWDFDGNPGNGWDIDWNRDARADQIQTWQFVTARTYVVTMAARNTYFDGDSVKVRDLVVTPEGGNPHPPEPDNYALVPAGMYILGDSSYVVDGLNYPTDLVERPIHRVQITSRFNIEKTEVTNHLYLDYLQGALDSAKVEFRGGTIYSHNPRDPGEPAVVYLVLNRSRIYFNLDTEGFAIQPGFEDHPVTGVTWFGARAYAVNYGLRLPTEAEWEIAARGDHESWEYPFVDGVELTRTEGPKRVNYAGSRSGLDPFIGTTTPRGFYDGRLFQGLQTIDTPSAFGTYDMAGNVGEWVGDWQGPYPLGLDIDPQGATFGTYKVVRGGSHQSSRVGVRCTARMGLLPEDSYPAVGFRTAFLPSTPSVR